MKKKWIFSMLCFVYLTFIATVAEAKSVTVMLPDFPVKLNGQLMENQYNQYPLLVYQDITYFPMAYYYSRFLGIKTNWYEQQGVCFIGNDSIATNEFAEYRINTANHKVYTATTADYKIAVNTTEVSKYLDNQHEEYPLLNFRDVTYVPLTWHFAVDEFGWEYAYDNKNGLSINSAESIRPVVDDSKIGDTSPQRGLGNMGYVYGTQGYVGYPKATIGGYYDFLVKTSGGVERCFSLKDQLSDADYYFDARQDTNGFINPNSDIKPSLDGNILSIVCVKRSSVNEGNQLLKIDVEAGKIVSAETIPLKMV